MFLFLFLVPGRAPRAIGTGAYRVLLSGRGANRGFAPVVQVCAPGARARRQGEERAAPAKGLRACKSACGGLRREREGPCRCVGWQGHRSAGEAGPRTQRAASGRQRRGRREQGHGRAGRTESATGAAVAGKQRQAAGKATTRTGRPRRGSDVVSACVGVGR